MAKILNDNSKLLSGSPQSTELSENQSKIVNICAYFGKIAMTISQTPVSSRVKKPNGYQTMMDAIKADGKDPMTILPEDWEKYEHELYELIEDEPLGGTADYRQILLMYLANNSEFTKIMESAVKESINLAERTDNSIFENPKDLSKLT